jgi:hypothetical protein
MGERFLHHAWLLPLLGQVLWQRLLQQVLLVVPRVLVLLLHSSTVAAGGAFQSLETGDLAGC